MGAFLRKYMVLKIQHKTDSLDLNIKEQSLMCDFQIDSIFPKSQRVILKEHYFKLYSVDIFRQHRYTRGWGAKVCI